MSVTAVGAYLEALRDAQKLKPKDVVALISKSGIDTTSTYIWRIENGKITAPGAQLLAAFTRAVHGDINHVMDLLLREDATAEDGRRFAEIWLQQQNIHQQNTQTIEEQAYELLTEEQLNLMKEIIPTLTDEEFARLVEEIKAAVEEEDSSSDPSLIDALRNFVSGWRARSRRTSS